MPGRSKTSRKNYSCELMVDYLQTILNEFYVIEPLGLFKLTNNIEDFTKVMNLKKSYDSFKGVFERLDRTS